MKKNHSNQASGKVSFVYFSCAAHFEYLTISIRSIRKLRSPLANRIYVYIDLSDELSEEQIETLHRFDAKVVIRRTVHEMSWAGEKLIRNELTAFSEIKDDLAEDEYLAKVDSDIIFISDSILHSVVRSNAHLYGIQVAGFPNFTWVQGGLYFIHRSVLDQLERSYPEEIIDTLAIINRGRAVRGKAPIGECPEDAFFTRIIQKITSQIVFVEPYYPLLRDFNGRPSLKRQLHTIVKGIKSSDPYSVLHFQQCKHKMTAWARRNLP